MEFGGHCVHQAHGAGLLLRRGSRRQRQRQNGSGREDTGSARQGKDGTLGNGHLGGNTNTLSSAENP